MMLTPFFAWLFYILACLLFLFILSKLIKRSSLPKAKRQSLLFIIFACMCIAFAFISSKVYVIKSRTEHEKYIIFGSATYTFKNGKTRSFNMSSRYRIVNNYDRLLENRTLYFSDSFRIAPEIIPLLVDPYSTEPVPAAVDYFFDTEKPESIPISTSAIQDPKRNTEKTRYWLYEYKK